MAAAGAACVGCSDHCRLRRDALAANESGHLTYSQIAMTTLHLSQSLHLRPEPIRGEYGRVETIGHRAWWCGVRAYLHLYHGLTVANVGRIPRQPPFVLVSNHASHLDALVLKSQLCLRSRQRTHPIASQETFFRSPAKSLFVTTAPAHYRSCGAARALHNLQSLRRRLLTERCGFIMFPEGTAQPAWGDGRVSRRGRDDCRRYVCAGDSLLAARHVSFASAGPMGTPAAAAPVVHRCATAIQRCAKPPHRLAEDRNGSRAPLAAS